MSHYDTTVTLIGKACTHYALLAGLVFTWLTILNPVNPGRQRARLRRVLELYSCALLQSFGAPADWLAVSYLALGMRPNAQHVSEVHVGNMVLRNF